MNDKKILCDISLCKNEAIGGAVCFDVAVTDMEDSIRNCYSLCEKHIKYFSHKFNSMIPSHDQKINKAA